MLDIVPNEITSILLADGWHPCEGKFSIGTYTDRFFDDEQTSYRTVTRYFEIYDEPSETYLTGPVSSIIAFKGHLGTSQDS